LICEGTGIYSINLLLLHYFVPPFPPALYIMPSLKLKRSLLMACIMATGSLAFHHAALRCQLMNLSCNNGTRRRQRIHTTIMTASSATEANAVTQKRGGESPSGACYYKRMDGSWKPRKELNTLLIGERLFAARLPERYVLRRHLPIAIFIDPHGEPINSSFLLDRDLLYGKTGPKGSLCTILSSISHIRF
jgi:hypothetical protein